MTAGNLTFAQDLLTLEVKDRQRGIVAVSSNAEVGAKDLDRIIKALRNALETGIPEGSQAVSDDDIKSEEVEESEENECRSRQGVEMNYGQEVSVPTHVETNNEATPFTPAKRQKLSESQRMPARIATLRGKAMRREQEVARLKSEAAKLQGEAAKLKAEAYELESRCILQSSE